MKQSSVFAHLVKGSAGSFAIIVGGTALSLLTVFILARILGAAGYGAYAYAKTWISLLSVPALLGLEGIIIRSVAAYRTKSEWGLMRGLLRRSNQIALCVSLGLALTGIIVSLLLEGRFDPRMLSAFRVSLLLLPFVALTRLRSSVLQGLHHVVVGQLPSMLLQPVFLIVLVGAALLMSTESLTATGTMGLHVAAAAFSCLIAMRLLHMHLPKAFIASAPVYQTRSWLRSALPLLFVTGMYIVISGTDMLMLGSVKGAEQVGAYAIAKRGAGLIPFIMMAVNSALGPTISSLYAQKDMPKLQRIITKSVRIIFLTTIPAAFGLAVFGHWFLQVFGSDFTQGQVSLAILSTGELINIALGSVGLLLVMTGHERDASKAVGICAILNIILNAILIPQWGMNGAAAATTVSMIILNVCLAVFVHKRLGIHPTVAGKIQLRRDVP